MTSPAGAISGAPYRGATWTPSYAPTQQAYRYSAPLAQPTYAYTTTQHSTTTVSTLKLMTSNASNPVRSKID